MSAMPEMIPSSSPLLPPPSRRRYQSCTKPERYVATMGMTVIGTALLAIWIGGYARLTVTGYQVSHLQAELNTLQQSNRTLTERVALLQDPGRINFEATRLAMVRATPSQTLYVPGAGPSAPALPTHHSRLIAFLSR